MKTELRAKPHSVLTGAVIVEIWHDGHFLATVAGADGPGVRIITKHGITARPETDDGSGINAMDVRIVAE